MTPREQIHRCLYNLWVLIRTTKGTLGKRPSHDLMNECKAVVHLYNCVYENSDAWDLLNFLNDVYNRRYQKAYDLLCKLEKEYKDTPIDPDLAWMRPYETNKNDRYLTKPKVRKHRDRTKDKPRPNRIRNRKPKSQSNKNI